jgi:hypothetical protein
MTPKICIPNGRKINQMAIKYTNLFHCKTFLNLLIFLVFLKIRHLATPLSTGNPRFESLTERLDGRIARFFLVNDTKTGKSIE